MSRFTHYLRRRAARFITKRRRLALKVSLYDLGFWIAVCALLVSVRTGHIGTASNSLMALAGLPLIFALAIEIHGWVGTVERWSRGSVYGKGLMAGLLTMSAALSAGYASTVINEFSGTASNPFPYTTTFIAVPATLIVVLALITLLYVGLITRAFGFAAWSMLIGYLHLLPFLNGRSLQRSRNRLKRRTQLEFIRLMAMVMLFLGITFVSPWFEKGLIGLAEIFAYSFETYANDRCANPGERVVRVSDDMVLVAVAKKWTVAYVPRRCARDLGVNPA